MQAEDTEETQISLQREKVLRLISDLQNQQTKIAKYAQKNLKNQTFESVMEKATDKVREDILYGKENLWG